ncbi:uncharacterized protein A4U43_C06F7990 [Asparagus officinalis]|uniref:Uncharacterized protein n=1 Tax=Asparagus officinalis TaxID=4686 RepID=A0A5P1EKK9_ASPOF|nr:uncharacterized protein A4U43_C06F7990 [Asparagus officinalis]
MSLPILSIGNGNSPAVSSDAYMSKFRNSKVESSKPFASVTMEDEKPFNFVRIPFGAIGGAASSLIRVPTEVVKQRMQTGQFASAPDAVRLIAAKEGFKGLYAGYSFFLLRDLPFDAIQFCLYEQLRIGYKIALNELWLPAMVESVILFQLRYCYGNELVIPKKVTMNILPDLGGPWDPL